MMHSLYDHLSPRHILIHGTKGLDTTGILEDKLATAKITRDNVHTMSEVILDESVVRRVGCLSGPNLASEILAGQPTATVIASEFDEVIENWKATLNLQEVLRFLNT